MKKRIIWIVAALAVIIIGAFAFSGPRYKNVDGWTAEQNKFVKEFLYESRKIPGRKVAVFDIDGTLIGQVPHYLADEAIFTYVEENKKDLMDYQINALSEMQRYGGDTDDFRYTNQRVNFLDGISPDNIAILGNDVWKRKFAGKAYPEMQQFVHNLQKFGWDIYAITCSPEFLYQDVVHEYFGIPTHNIIGRKAIVKQNIMTSENIHPIPCFEGKADTVWTFVKAAPLIAAGNSTGDAAMVATSAGIKIWVNPNSDKLIDGCNADEKCIIVHSNDVDERSNGDWAAARAGVKPNRPEPKDGR